MGRACTVVCRNRSSPTITPVCAGLDEKSPCMHTSFGEQSIGCSESNALTPAISRHLLESSNMPDKAQLLKSLVSTFSCTARIEIYFFHERLVYLINILVAIYFSQFLLLGVVFEYLDSLIKVDDQSSAHCFSSIIRALVELTSIKITNAIYFRRMIFDMVDMLSRLTEKSTSKPLE